MFTFMNTARIGTAIQGLAHAELSFQGAHSVMPKSAWPCAL